MMPHHPKNFCNCHKSDNVPNTDIWRPWLAIGIFLETPGFISYPPQHPYPFTKHRPTFGVTGRRSMILSEGVASFHVSSVLPDWHTIPFPLPMAPIYLVFLHPRRRCSTLSRPGLRSPLSIRTMDRHSCISSLVRGPRVPGKLSVW